MRQYALNNFIYTDTIKVAPDGAEYVIHREVNAGPLTRIPDEILSESISVEHHTSRYDVEVEIGGYLEEVKIDMDEDFEEFIGLKFRYVLTDKAIALLKEHSA